MADPFDDFFDDPPAAHSTKNGFNERDDGKSKVRGTTKIETRVPTVRTEARSDDSEDDSPRSRKGNSRNNRNANISLSGSESESDEELKPGGKRQAWTDTPQTSNGTRPKSAHPGGRPKSGRRGRNRTNSGKSESPSRSRSGSSRSRSRSGSSRSRSRSGSRSGSNSDDSSDYTTSETDSDMTDVSPLPSPTFSGRKAAKKGKGSARSKTPSYGTVTLSKPPKSPSGTKGESVSGRSRPTSAKLEKLLRPDQDTMDLKLLMQAVLEMEKERERENEMLKTRTRVKPQFQVAPHHTSTAPRKNYSFNNAKAREIDKENTRLMQKIMENALTAKRHKQQIRTQSRTQPVVPHRVTTSAVNRKKEQERIDRENRVCQIYVVKVLVKYATYKNSGI